MSADRIGLERLGFMFGGITAAVMLIACTVVLGHVNNRHVSDLQPTRIVALQ
jgi:hypothetical protein